MSNTYIGLYIHYIFSTIQRLPLIIPEIQSRLWPYIGGVAKQNDMKALAVGGITDHVHILLSLPAPISIAKAIQLIKGNSSKWVNDTFETPNGFAWQKGYGAFSVNISIVPDYDPLYRQPGNASSTQIVQRGIHRNLGKKSHRLR